MTQTFSGSCLCGGVAYEVTGNASEFFLCHCSRCQNACGSAHTSNLLIESATLSWVKGEDNITSFTLPETLFTRTFCTNCGSPLPSFEADLLIVPAGSLNDDPDLRPTAHIYMGSRAGWDNHLEQVDAYDEMPEVL